MISHIYNQLGMSMGRDEPGPWLSNLGPKFGRTYQGLSKAQFSIDPAFITFRRRPVVGL